MNPVLIFLAACCCLGFFDSVAHAADATEPAQSPNDKPKQDNFQARLGKGLSYVSDDQNFKVGLSAWGQADAALYNSDTTPLADGTRIRRSRIALSAQLYRDWKLRAEYDFSNKKNQDIRGFQDLYLRYTGVRNTSFTIGNMKEPVGLEWQTSSKNTTFMERSLATALLRPYGLGFAAKTHGKSWTLSGGLFGERMYDGISTGNGWGSSGRVTFSPLHKKKLTLHFGLSGAYRERGPQSSNLRFSSRPEANVDNIRFANTDSMHDVADHKLMGLEFAALHGPLSLQSEYIRAFVNRDSGRSDLQFDGWYVYGSWFITGESRKYAPKSGAFGHIKPKHEFDLKGGTGAIEVAARYSELNLNDQRMIGGREDNITLGVNWYLNSNIRLMGNYVFVQTDNNAFGIRNGGSEQPEIFELRAQVEF